MDQQNNDSDKIEFKVKFLGEYYDIVIDRNDDKYIYKTQQLFQQLALITGIPSKYANLVKLFGAEPDDYRPSTHHCIFNDIPLTSDLQPVWPVRKDLRAFDNAVPRYHLSFQAASNNVAIPNILITYNLIPESEVPEGVCSRFYCQYKYTKSFFDKIKRVIYNEELHSKLEHVHSDRTLGWERWFMEKAKIIKEFNVGQYIHKYAPCVHQFDRAGRAYGAGNSPLYNRNRDSSSKNGSATSNHHYPNKNESNRVNNNHTNSSNNSNNNNQQNHHHSNHHVNHQQQQQQQRQNVQANQENLENYRSTGEIKIDESPSPIGFLPHLNGSNEMNSNSFTRPLSPNTGGRSHFPLSYPRPFHPLLLESMYRLQAENLSAVAKPLPLSTPEFPSLFPDSTRFLPSYPSRYQPPLLNPLLGSPLSATFNDLMRHHMQNKLTSSPTSGSSGERSKLSNNSSSNGKGDKDHHHHHHSHRDHTRDREKDKDKERVNSDAVHEDGNTVLNELMFRNPLNVLCVIDVLDNKPLSCVIFNNISNLLLLL